MSLTVSPSIPPPARRASRVLSWLVGCIATTLMAACGGGGGDPLDRAIGAALNFEGQFEALDGLAVELAGDSATILDFGNSPLGSNPAVLSVGQPFARNVVRTGDSSFSADVAVPTHDGNGTLGSLSYMPMSVSLESGVPVITGAPAGYAYASGWKSHTPAATVPADAFAANCAAYWQPILAANDGKWRVKRLQADFAQPDADPLIGRTNWIMEFSDFRPGFVRVRQAYDIAEFNHTFDATAPDAQFAQFPWDRVKAQYACRINGSADGAGVLFLHSYDAITGELVAFSDPAGLAPGLMTLQQD